MEVLGDIPELPASPRAEELAVALIDEGAVPAVARIDAAHVAVAAVHGMDFLVTWNCRHIANARNGRAPDVVNRHEKAAHRACLPAGTARHHGRLRGKFIRPGRVIRRWKHSLHTVGVK